MENPLKVLIAAACVAIIAVAGLMFWQERQATQQAEQISLRYACQDDLHRASTGTAQGSPVAIRNRLMKCFTHGNITQAELDDLIH